MNFYKNLNLDLQVQSDLIDDLSSSLSESERESCEGEFTQDELFSALKGLHTGRAPDFDGLPTDRPFTLLFGVTPAMSLLGF